MSETLTVRERIAPGSFLTPPDALFAARVTAPAYLSVADDDWTFALACTFWKLLPGNRRRWGAGLDRHLDAFAGRLALCAAALECYAGDDGLASGLRQARALHRTLLERYRKHLTLLRLRGRDGE